MIPYFILLAVPAIFAVTIKPPNGERRNRIIIDSFFAIFLVLLVLRSESVGVDLANYKLNFLKYNSYSVDYVLKLLLGGKSESGFMLLSKLIGAFTDNFRIMMIVCALISVIPIWKLYRKEPVYGFLTLVLFINIAPFSMYFSGLRQAMAMAFVYPAYCFTKEKKIWPFLLSVLAAFLFHKSALILLLLYPVYHLRLKSKKYLLLILPVIAVIWYFASPIFMFLSKFIGSEYASRYLSSVQSTGAYAVSALLILFVIYSYVLPDDGKMDFETVGLRNILVLAAVLQLFSGVHTIAMRMNYYFLLLIPLLIPRIVQRTTKGNGAIAKISLIVFVAFFAFYFYYKAFTDADVLQVYPYLFLRN